MARLMSGLMALAGSSVAASDPDFALVTITHARLGAPAFGVAPGDAEIHATMRALTDDGMSRIVAEAEALANELALAEGLEIEIKYDDVFPACHNNPEAADVVRKSLEALDIEHGPYGLPLRASEDFGAFGSVAKLALMFLGSGEDRPALHNPDYDFPDALIGIGAAIFAQILEEAAQTTRPGAQTTPQGQARRCHS